MAAKTRTMEKYTICFPVRFSFMSKISSTSTAC